MQWDFICTYQDLLNYLGPVRQSQIKYFVLVQIKWRKAKMLMNVKYRELSPVTVIVTLIPQGWLEG